MSVIYKWVIYKLDTVKQEGNLFDVVKNVHWRYQAIDGEYLADTFDAFKCDSPSESDFTAYPDLTENQIIEWLESGLNINDLQYGLNIQLEQLKNPPIINLPLPWNEEIYP